jgi:myosin protein heavy chain
MKTQVEVEALQEQLRIRKEKQYQLLEKLQGQEEAQRQAEDHVAGMEEKLRALHARHVELETQLQVDIRMRQSAEESNRGIQIDNDNLANSNRDLQVRREPTHLSTLRVLQPVTGEN